MAKKVKAYYIFYNTREFIYSKIYYYYETDYEFISLSTEGETTVLAVFTTYVCGVH